MTQSIATVTPLAEADRKKAPAVRGSRKGPVIPDPPLYQQVQRIGGGLTPAVVSRVIREADLGQMASLMDLGNEIRQKDCHLQGILETRETSVSAVPWELALPTKPTKKEKLAAQVSADAVEALMPTLAPHHNGAVFPGYAVSELAWKKSGKYVLPFSAEAKRQRRFRYVGERLVWWDAGMSEPVDFRAEYPGRFVVSEPRVNGDTRCREGLIRPLLWAALFKNWGITDWLKLAEIAWKPWRTGTYKKGATDEDIDALVDVLDDMASSGVAVLPETVELEIHQMLGSSQSSGAGTHPTLISFMNAEMSKATLGQTLTTEQGTRGTQALGNVHENVRKDKRDNDAGFISRDISRDVIAWITLINFGPGVRPAQLKFATDDAPDLDSLSKATKTFVEAGLVIPADHIRDKAGIPAPKDGEEVLGAKPEEPKPSPGNPETENEPDGSEEDGKEDIEEDASDE